MTHFFCDIEILCVQNNKAHFLLDIKLNGHLTYKRDERDMRECHSRSPSEFSALTFDFKSR